MDSELYKIQQQNFLTILSFYNKAREKADNYYSFIEKYKNDTKEYLKKIKYLFSYYSPALYEQIEDLFGEEKKENEDDKDKEEDADDLYLDTRNRGKSIFDLDLDNNKNKQNNIINIKNDIKVNNIEVDYSPIYKMTNTLFKQLKIQIKSLKLFLKGIDSSIENLKNVINNTKKEIQKLKDSYLNSKQQYFQDFESYGKDNQGLLKNYSKLENKLTQFFYLKNNEDIYLNNKNALNINIQELENELNVEIIQLKKKEKLFIEKDKEKKNICMKYNNETEECIQGIKKGTLLIIENMRLNIEKVLDNYTNCYNLNYNELLNNIKKIQESKTEKEYEENIQKKLKEINEDIILSSSEKFKPIQYEIQILKNKTINEKLYNLLINNGYDVKKGNFVLTEDDIFLIIRKMYNFTLINKDKYDIDKENKKIYIIKIINEIFDNRDKQRKIINNPKISEEKLTKLYKDLESDRDLRYTFLEQFGNKRAESILELDIGLFNIITEIFLIIADSLVKEKDISIERQVLILTQTYYKTENGEQKYLYQVISKHQLFKNQEFWTDYINNTIQIEIEKKEFFEKKIGKIVKSKEIKEKNKEIVFVQLLTISECMKNYELKEDEIINIINPIIEYYELDQINKDAIFENIKPK